MECVDRPIVQAITFGSMKSNGSLTKSPDLGTLAFGAVPTSGIPPNRHATFTSTSCSRLRNNARTGRTHLQRSVCAEASRRGIRTGTPVLCRGSGDGSSGRQCDEGPDKADAHLKALTTWLQHNMLTAFDVVHQGVSKKMLDFLKLQKTGNMTVRELVNLVGTVALEPIFEERYPEYPNFQ